MLYQNTTLDSLSLKLTQESSNNIFTPLKHTLAHTEEALELLKPETDLEKSFLDDDEFMAGLFWGKPRFGHPEGEVVYHIREVLDNIEKLDIDAKTRRQLRIITFVHDTFKHLEDRSRPRDWSRHHAALARNFLQKYTDEKILLDITHLHDEAYYAWRAIHLYNKVESGQKRMKHLLDTVGSNLQLYYLFFKCDTQTGDKVQAPVRWFEEAVPGIEIVYF